MTTLDYVITALSLAAILTGMIASHTKEIDAGNHGRPDVDQHHQPLGR